MSSKSQYLLGTAYHSNSALLLLQLWLGRLAMLLFLGLVGYEALHSNRPLLGSFFYLLP